MTPPDIEAATRAGCKNCLWPECHENRACRNHAKRTEAAARVLLPKEPSEEMIEDMARVAYEEFCRGQPWCEATDGWKTSMRESARAAYRALWLRTIGDGGEGLSDERSETAEKIIDMILALPVAEREQVIAEVQHNGIFCWHCGFGDRETPNENCQCWNDE